MYTNSFRYSYRSIRYQLELVSHIFNINNVNGKFDSLEVTSYMLF